MYGVAAAQFSDLHEQAAVAAGGVDVDQAVKHAARNGLRDSHFSAPQFQHSP
jgi:hypothetical protein